MNIKNFEKHINDTILERWYYYYANGNIIEFDCEGNGTYKIKVEGTEDYEVIIKIYNKGEIIYSKCDCPYDFGSVCKHEVASYYRILEDIGIIDKVHFDKKIKKNELEVVLNSLSKEQLVNIVENMAKKDKMFKYLLILKYSKVDSEKELENCQNLIKSIVRKHCGRNRFISYGKEHYSYPQKNYQDC